MQLKTSSKKRSAKLNLEWEEFWRLGTRGRARRGKTAVDAKRREETAGPDARHKGERAGREARFEQEIDLDEVDGEYEIDDANEHEQGTKEDRDGIERKRDDNGNRGELCAGRLVEEIRMRSRHSHGSVETEEHYESRYGMI